MDADKLAIVDISNTRSRGYRQFSMSDKAPELVEAVILPKRIKLEMGNIEVTFDPPQNMPQGAAAGIYTKMKVNGKEVAAKRILVEITMDDLPRVELDFYPTLGE